MANKEALRNLQARLATRLQEAQSTGTQAAWLAVEAGQGRFLLPLELVGEIFPYAHAHAVPYTQDWFLGTVNLRGQIFGAIDTGLFLGLQAQTSQLQTEASRLAARLVTLHAGLGVNSALLVTRLQGLRRIEHFQALAPRPVQVPDFYAQAYVDTDGHTWQELNLQALVEAEAFLNITA